MVRKWLRKITARTRRAWKRFRNKGRPGLSELSETGCELWARHALRDAGISPSHKNFPKWQYQVSHIVKLYQDEQRAGKRFQAERAWNEKSDLAHEYNKEMHHAQEQRFEEQAKLIHNLGEQGRVVLEKIHQMFLTNQ